MSEHNIILPSKPKIVSEEGFAGVYEIDGLYPGYGHTLGNSLRRIILSSLPGAAITSVKIDGVSHEFSTLEGMKEDVIVLLLHLKKVRFKMVSNEPQTATISVKGAKNITAGDIKTPGQLEVLNPDLPVATLTDKKSELHVELRVEKGLGYIPKEVLQEGKVDVGVIAVDASFTPIRRVSYEVENMRVGDRTDYNRLRISIETDGTITPHEALEKSIIIMIEQLKAIVGFQEEAPFVAASSGESITDSEQKNELSASSETKKSTKAPDTEFLKTRIEKLPFSTRTMNALDTANIRTVGGLVRKKEEDLKVISGLGTKGIEEIKEVLGTYGITLK
ncbi:MAG: DNA-directed RNA polymerase subunit alpha [Candidatus Lloydbacteria bacterium]|nr:DNA-directed RNA polymerase subunit alpha [Candidatus Lloydbacteria bacterium]